MRRPLTLLVSVAAANIAFAINVPQDQSVFHSTNDGAQIGLERNNKETKDSLRSGYVIHPRNQLGVTTKMEDNKLSMLARAHEPLRMVRPDRAPGHAVVNEVRFSHTSSLSA
ncbi:MAG: hypothetical protein J3Q66DRAFT_349488 [Benniella sp.]|nr:MAG: hypothetical protein J3Q66DRAFT_349488 [Benniella sp.]